jgi:hypothetical protein
MSFPANEKIFRRDEKRSRPPVRERNIAGRRKVQEAPLVEVSCVCPGLP